MKPTLGRAALAALAGFVVAAATVAGVVAARSPGAPDPEEAREYAAGIEQVARAAGAIIEFEMKPAIGDLRAGVFEPDPTAVAAGQWADSLAGLRDGLADVDPPRGIGGAHDGFVAAFDGYREVADLIAEAADADADDRERLLDDAVALGDDTDQVWNAARERLKADLEPLGIDVQLGMVPARVPA